MASYILPDLLKFEYDLFISTLYG